MNLNELIHNTCVKFAKRNAFLLKNDKTVYPVTFEEFEKRYNIPKENILISATHTHTGPSTINMPGWGDIDRNYYEEILKDMDYV